MLISIVIPAYNEAKYLGATLEKLQQALGSNSGQAIRWEIIVCDNNSTDTTAVVARRAGANVVFERHNQISRARNSGAKAANGEWLVFLDADSYPPPALIADVLALIQTGAYIGCGTTVEVSGGTLFNKLRMERLNPIFRLFNWSGGVFLLCRGDAFQAIGGFSTRLYAYEEIDFVFRLKKFGRKNRQEFTVLHQHPVITSGRKGEYRPGNLITLFHSNLLAIVLFAFGKLLPEKFIDRLAGKWLRYWYHGQR